MADEIQLWRDAQEDAELTPEEVELVIAACEGIDGIRLELSYLVTQLSRNLGGHFLREFVDQLRQHGPEAEPTDSLMVALLTTVMAEPTETVMAEPGDSAGEAA